MPAIGASAAGGSTASAPSFSGGSAVVVGSSVLVTTPSVGGGLRHPAPPRVGDNASQGLPRTVRPAQSRTGGPSSRWGDVVPTPAEKGLWHAPGRRDSR